MEDIEAGTIGGLFLSAGGSGRNQVAKNVALGRMALDYGGVRLVSLDVLDPDALVISATAVGAPGFANWQIRPRDAIDAARRLVAHIGKPIAGVICGTLAGGLIGLFIGPVVLAVFYDLLIAWVASGSKIVGEVGSRRVE